MGSSPKNWMVIVHGMDGHGWAWMGMTWAHDNMGYMAWVLNQNKGGMWHASWP